MKELEKFYQIGKSGTSKLILTSVGIFPENGWKPKEIDNLNAASIGKPVLIGGFDIKRRIPKKMYKSVPAGSVYVFDNNKTQDFDAREFLNEYEYSYKGFNQGIIIPLNREE